MADTKDTIYVDVDDEITTIIDKVKASNSKVVALVLPKRASVLQSIVNLKLLKRSADNQKKNLVLITSEAGILPLAGAVGVHVAKTLNSAPEIPPPPIGGDSDAETVEEDMSVVPLDDDVNEETPDLTKDAGTAASVGALADAAKHQSKSDHVLDTLNLESEEEADATTKGLKSKVVKNKHLKVPNFNRFRVILMISVIVIIGLIVLGVFALKVWPQATISIKTDATTVGTNLSLTLDPQAQSVDLVSGDIPAKQISEQKTFTQTVNTTGQKNIGAAATGSVNLTATDCNLTYSPQFTIPTGTGISYNNLTFITKSSADMTYQGINNKTERCPVYATNGTINIIAQSPGTQSNTQIQNGTVANYPEVLANGSASNGTDNIVSVVSQADIDSATTKINANNGGTALADLSNQLKGQGLYPITATFAAGTPQITSNPNIGEQGSTVTVTEIITYTMFGAKQSDINAVVDASIHSQTSKIQNIISNGVNQGAFKQVGTSGSADQVSLVTTATVGPNISVTGIKQETKGKSAQDAISAIKQNPDVTSVTIRLSPFWVRSIPSNFNKIIVVIAKPSVTTHS